MQIINTIIPIFLVIGLGAVARRQGLLSEAFLAPANRLVYYLAIPAMIFRATCQTSIAEEIQLMALVVPLICVVMVFLIAFLTIRVLGPGEGYGGTWIQCAFHGNLGYIGLAVIFYYLGDSGLAKGSILAGFMMILQNFLAVIALQWFNPQTSGHVDLKHFLRLLGTNPVIVSALLGIAFGLTGWPLPLIADRGLKILGGMALPMALLLIGASLSLGVVRLKWHQTLSAGLLKLVLLPALGLAGFLMTGLTPEAFLPALILLAAPTATLSYVFAQEMAGDPQLAVASISLGTIASALTFTLWLNLGALLG